MLRSKSVQKSRKYRRSAYDVEEEESRSLYLRIPPTCKSDDEIKNLLFGSFKIQNSHRSPVNYRQVVFSNNRDKIKNLKALKKKIINGKHIIASSSRPISSHKPINPKCKRFTINSIDDNYNDSVKHLVISKIPSGIEASEIKNAFPGSVAVGLIKGSKDGQRQAQVQMSSTEMCLKYENEEIEWPILRGKRIEIAFPKRLPDDKEDDSTPLKEYFATKRLRDDKEDDSNPLKEYFAKQMMQSETVQMENCEPSKSCSTQDQDEDLDDTLIVCDDSDDEINKDVTMKSYYSGQKYFGEEYKYC